MTIQLCLYCGRPILPRKNRRGRLYTPMKYCCATCYKKARRKRLLERFEKLVGKACNYCGKIILPQVNAQKTMYIPTKYCSRSCYTKGKRKATEIRIREALCTPMTTRELSKALGRVSLGNLREKLRRMEQEGTLKRIVLRVGGTNRGGRGSIDFGGATLFGKLAAAHLWYKPTEAHRNLLTKIVIKNLPTNISTGMRRAYTHHLRTLSYLEPEVYQTVKNAINHTCTLGDVSEVRKEVIVQ